MRAGFPGALDRSDGGERRAVHRRSDGRSREAGHVNGQGGCRPERLKPFTVSAENLNCPADDGAGNCQFPTASTGTSNGWAGLRLWPWTVMRTLEFGATTEAGPASTWPLIGSPAVTVPLAAAASVRLGQEQLQLDAAGDPAGCVLERSRDGPGLYAAVAFSAPVCVPTAKFPLIHGPPESPGRDLTVVESKPFSARRSLS